MHKLVSTFAMTAAAVGLVAIGTAAQSATVIKTIDGGPFSGANPIGGFPVIELLTADTYDFTFTIDTPVAGVTQLQLQAQTELTHAAEPISFDLYSGTPTGTHSLIAASPVSTSSVLSELLTPGAYFVQVTPSQIAVNKEVDSGSLIAASVPEPASWALMLIGVGAIGAALRASGARKPERASLAA